MKKFESDTRGKLSWMRILRAVLLLLFSSLVPVPASAETLTFSPMLIDKPETVASRWRPTLDHLEKVLGANIRIVIQPDYGKIIEKFRQGEIDLAFLGPLPYLELKHSFPAAEPVAHIREADGRAKYTCAIVALAERRFAIAALRDKTIALTQPLSTCGYLGTDGILRQAGSGLEYNRYRYLGSHENVALAVARGDYDAGGLKTVVGQRYEHLGVRVIAESEALPSFALIANARKLSPARIERIRKALVSVAPAMRAGWGGALQHGFESASDRDYDGMRRFRIDATIPQQGNY